MVQEHTRTRLDGFSVWENVLTCDGRKIAKFPTPICELARLDSTLFVILHPYPIEQQIDYAGENLWAVKFDGSVLWKAENLTGKLRPGNRFNYYSGIKFIDQLAPKILTNTDDDRLCPVIDISTGKHIHSYRQVSGRNLSDEVFAKATLYLLALPCDPPASSKLPAPSP
jgi:hypothetical protein